MRAIRPSDFCKTAAALLGPLGFFAFIITLEWHRADFAPKVICLTLWAIFAILALRALVIYRPRQIDVDSLKPIRGPFWSITILSTDYVWIEVENDAKVQRIRLVE
jgi:hypothetical protein